MNKHFGTYYCKECNNQISYKSALYGTGLCRSCAMIGNKNPNINNYPTKQTFCMDCHTEIWNGQKRCEECYHKSQIGSKRDLDLFLGENNPNWQGGLSFGDYSIEFNNILKRKVRDLDNHECQICHKTEVELDEILCVHHIDYNKENCEIENLISLCRKCHAITNGNRDYWYAYFTELILQKV